jgi:hypothetical protein
VAQAECRTSGCERAGQISGVVKGYCCALCSIRDGGNHASICNMIEEAGRAEIVIADNIVLGYD